MFWNVFYRLAPLSLLLNQVNKGDELKKQQEYNQLPLQMEKNTVTFVPMVGLAPNTALSYFSESLLTRFSGLQSGPTTPSNAATTEGPTTTTSPSATTTGSDVPTTGEPPAGSPPLLIGFTPAAFYSILVGVVVVMAALTLLICYILKNKGMLVRCDISTDEIKDLEEKSSEHEEESHSEMIDAEQKQELENLRDQLKSQLEEVEKKIEKNEEKLQSVEDEITEAEKEKKDKEGLLKEKENLNDIKWELDEQKTNWEKLIQNMVKVLQIIDDLDSRDQVPETTAHGNQGFEHRDKGKLVRRVEGNSEKDRADSWIYQFFPSWTSLCTIMAGVTVLMVALIVLSAFCIQVKAGSTTPLIQLTPAAFYSSLVLVVVDMVMLILLIGYTVKNKDPCVADPEKKPEEKLQKNTYTVDALKQQKQGVENRKDQLKSQLEEVEKKKKENKEKLQSVENNITKAEKEKKDKGGLLKEKETLTDQKWKLDEQKTNLEKLILNVEQILQRLDVLVVSERNYSS